MARPFRYTFILVLVALSTCLAAVSGWRYARASAPVSGPIILISIDSLRADRLPPYGYLHGRTPAIDSLAADGIVFEQAYSHVPQTLPAHAALLTGRIPIETGIRDGVTGAVPRGERLVAEMLRDRDFATGAVVSSFLLRAQTGIGQGFDFFDADMLDSDGRQGLHRDGAASVRLAERWLASVGTTRAFLFLHVDEPRGMEDVPERFSDLEPYDARIAQADEAVGRLIRYLKTHQLYDQSTVLLVSDHGQGLGQHGEQGHGLFVYDDTVRVPLIIKPSAGQGAGRRVQVPVQHVDLVPTILDLAKAPVPGNLHGRSLTPLFDGRGSLSPAPIYIESVFGSTRFAWSELTSVVEDGYRYIRAPREELYDLARDPGERENLIAFKPDVAARLRGTLRTLVSRTAAAGVSRERLTPEDRTRYEALGYVGDPSPHFMGPREPVDPKDRWEIVEQFRRAVDLSVADDWHAALETLREVVRREPLMIDAWLRLASLAARSERHDVAADAYKRVALHEPANQEARLSAADALLRLKKYDEARQVAQRSVADSIDQDDIRSRAHEILARIALARRNFDVARSEAELAESANASRPVIAYVDGRIALDKKRYLEALEHFEAALAAMEKGSGGMLADLRLFAAEAMLRAERFPDAEGLFRAQLADAPLNTRARAGMAAVHAATGRENESTRAGH